MILLICVWRYDVVPKMIVIKCWCNLVIPVRVLLQQSIPILILLCDVDCPIHKEADTVYQPFMWNCSTWVQQVRRLCQMEYQSPSTDSLVFYENCKDWADLFRYEAGNFICTRILWPFLGKWWIQNSGLFAIRVTATHNHFAVWIRSE